MLVSIMFMVYLSEMSLAHEHHAHGHVDNVAFKRDSHPCLCLTVTLSKCRQHLVWCSVLTRQQDAELAALLQAATDSAT